MSDYLPKDVLIDILTKLPLKTLVRCTSVCKSWYSLITSPIFISTHLEARTASKSNRLLFIRHFSLFDREERYALHDDDESFTTHDELKCPLNSSNEYFRVAGCCNGLICLSDDYDSYTDTVVLWNPSMNSKYMELPRPNFHYNGRGSCIYGFGFDDLTRDFKVVRIVYNSNATEDYKFEIPPSVDFLDKLRKIKFTVPPQVEIYRFSIGSWRTICDVAPSYIVCQNSCVSVFVNRAVHWVASNENDDNEEEDSKKCYSFVAAFDMGDEVFREIMMPECVADKSVLKLSVMVMGESLALVEYEKFWKSDYCAIWVMKEYSEVKSWTRLYNIDMRGGIRDVVGFRNNGEVLLSARLIGMVSYDPQVKKINYLGIHGTHRSFCADTYVESLALIKRTNRLPGVACSSSDVNTDTTSPLRTEDGAQD